MNDTITDRLLQRLIELEARIARLESSDRKLGDVRLTLGDTAGVNKVIIRDSSPAEVASVNSDGLFSGIGLAFPATQVASAGANTLDDYEEGTWTPTGNGITFASATGKYTKIGQFIAIEISVTWPVTANGNAAQMLSLPFSAVGQAGCYVRFTNSGRQDIWYVGTTDITPTTLAGAVPTNAQYSNTRVDLCGFFTV